MPNRIHERVGGRADLPQMQVDHGVAARLIGAGDDGLLGKWLGERKTGSPILVVATTRRQVRRVIKIWVEIVRR